MILVLSPKRAFPRVRLELGGYFNEEVAQKVPQYLPTPSPVSSEKNQQMKIETIRSHPRSVSQNTIIHPQDSDSYGPQPPPKGLLRPRENMRNVNQATHDKEEKEEKEENHYCGDGCEKGKEVEKENYSQNERDSD
ncbi:hypothetical protein O181_120852 [Austropuccinia psidii MF-1]|uniref:Uncharacterized protein n=1 Tax=Austropuccinia psidii MF-1 TaxID=1389203 RepID=A0A9Q3Q2T5_9BASI|nr:hypothetical protein [Austropuccinia psidii MF-1]